MSENWPVTDPLYVRYSGEWSWDVIHDLIKSWLVQNYYTKYTEKKNKTKVGGSGIETEIEIDADKKVTSLAKYSISIAIHIWDVKESDVIVDGKTQKINKGRIEIVLTGTVILDYQGAFEKDSGLNKNFQKKLKDWFFKIRFTELDSAHFDGLKESLYNLQTKIKEALHMETSYTAYNISSS
ncbi:MAG: hypothetical protein H6502_03925 [Candidatus Woesearchaeota archaeon]|nr:MAG: hypothetical protein H6502_03925 [Candidatus Woesearchaeota archaeon]